MGFVKRGNVEIKKIFKPEDLDTQELFQLEKEPEQENKKQSEDNKLQN